MTHSTSSIRSARGNALVPLLVILSALVISALVFFLFTKKKIDARQEAALDTPATPDSIVGPGSAPAVPVVASTTPKTEPAAPMVKPGETAPSPASAPLAVFGFNRPSDVGEQLARSLSAGDMAAAAKLLSAGDQAQEAAVTAMLDKLINGMGYKIAPDQIQVLGQVENASRIAIPLIDPKTGKVGDTKLMIDVERDPKMGFKVSRVHVPKELSAALAGTLPAAPTVTPGVAPALAPMAKPLITVDEGSDALSFASKFVNSLLKLDYGNVRKMVDEERVPSVKLAGLCIVFEEGKFVLSDSRPLVATLANDTNSWIIAKIHSDTRKEDTEFGVEMELQAGKGWRVTGLNLSKLLADNAKASELVGVPYTPLLQNPKGGESIALYYEYDAASLHPRAQKQLEIVASILKASPMKKLKIGGHTDAKGTDDYNYELSRRRAESVKQFMLAQGVPMAQVETVGFGKEKPLSPNVNADGSDNPEGRSRNRRAEIVLDF